MLRTPFPRIYPFATNVIRPSELSRNPFPGLSPIGVVIHYTAERGLAQARRSLDQSGLCYHLIIGRDGSCEQHAWLDMQVWHAGKATWNGYSPNVRFLAVAVESWGEVTLDPVERTLYRSWSGAKVPETQVTERPDNLRGDMLHWDACTPEQLETLQKALFWAVDLGVDPENVCGHDECALPVGRKTDPGGVLPMRMVEYRKFLMNEKAEAN